MAMSTLESGPKLNWTRDNQMYERYRILEKESVELLVNKPLLNVM